MKRAIRKVLDSRFGEAYVVRGVAVNIWLLKLSCGHTEGFRQSRAMKIPATRRCGTCEYLAERAEEVRV